MIFELLFLYVISITFFIILYNFTYNILVKASILNDDNNSNNNIKPILKKEVPNPSSKGLLNSTIEINKTIGVWGPISNSSHSLEELRGINLSRAISDITRLGFDEYYFVMSDFENPKLIDSTESLLQSAENLDNNLKIIIILLPPSEGGPNGNYDWKGWIDYFNSLKQRHPNSFEGFTIDDFNWISTRNDTKFEYNIDFMGYSNLIDALKDKRKDVKFFPTVYFEGKKTNVVGNKFLNYVDGIIAVSGCYYNVSALEPQLHFFRELFDNKPIKYIVYPTITHNYSRQQYSPPSDQLVISTLSIASRMADDILIWHKIDSPVIQEYLKNIDNNEAYLSKMSRIEEIQIREEQTEVTIDKMHSNLTEAEKNCQEWYNKYKL
ncbi:MAG: hypothetical protein ACRD8Z_03130 [Nitrososphaeraceae archaeon]